MTLRVTVGPIVVHNRSGGTRSSTGSCPGSVVRDVYWVNVGDMPKRLRTTTSCLPLARELASAQGCGAVATTGLRARDHSMAGPWGRSGRSRWQLIGDQSICLHNGEISPVGHRWAAVFQGGPRATWTGRPRSWPSGLARFDVERVRVSVPRGARVRRTRRYDIRQTRRWSADDVAPRRHPADPARSRGRAGRPVGGDGPAGDVRLDDGGAAGAGHGRGHRTGAARIRRDKRRALLHAVVNDLLDGVRSLGELDIGRELRRRGLPPPQRQVLRRDARNRYYLDLYWPEWKLVVEIDGIHHAWAENVVGDALRQNSLALDGDTVLRAAAARLPAPAGGLLRADHRGLRAAGWAAAA